MSSVETRKVTIVNRKGLHARASARLAELALTLPSKVLISFESESADARSIMDLLCLGAGIGNVITLAAEGPQASIALDAVAALFEDGFGELVSQDDPAKAPTAPANNQSQR